MLSTLHSAPILVNYIGYCFSPPLLTHLCEISLWILLLGIDGYGNRLILISEIDGRARLGESYAACTKIGLVETAQHVVKVAILCISVAKDRCRFDLVGKYIFVLFQMGIH